MNRGSLLGLLDDLLGLLGSGLLGGNLSLGGSFLGSLLDSLLSGGSLSLGGGFLSSDFPGYRGRVSVKLGKGRAKARPGEDFISYSYLAEHA
jgi:hypothetical protein